MIGIIKPFVLKKPSYILKNTNEAPAGGFCCYVEETGMRWHGISSFNHLEKEVANHLVANGLSPMIASELIHETTAKNLLERGFTHLVEEKVLRVSRSWEQWQDGSAAHRRAKKLKREGKKIFVGRALANQRAQACVEGSMGQKCPHNVFPQKTAWLQKKADEKMAKMKEGRKTDYDDKLGICDLCSCDLKSAPHYSAEVYGAPLSKEKFIKYPSYCWKKRELT